MQEQSRSRRPRSFPRSLALLAGAGLATAALAQVAPTERNQPPGPLSTPAPPPIPANQPPPPPPAPRAGEPAREVLDAHIYDISAFVFRYAAEHPDMPPIEEIQSLEVSLGQTAEGVYISSRPGVQTSTVTLADLTSAQRAGRRFSGSAINAIATRIVEFFNQRGLVGVAVLPAPGQINQETLEDLRTADQRVLVMEIWVRTVKEIRTLGAGPRWSEPTRPNGAPSLESRVDHPAHVRIRQNSPVQPGDLLRKNEIEDYISRLERIPGRRIDATVAAAETPGDVSLDYVITENRPWTAYFQLSNTGTKDTDEWRERFGFVDTQLTNRDDVLSIDYTTANFDQFNSLTGSYEAPLLNSQVIRWKAFGSWNDYTASDVGFQGENFEGDGWNAGGELDVNVLQVQRSFVDVFGGARYEHVHVRNTAAELIGEEDFFLPYIGARFTRETYKSSTNAEARLETNVPTVSGTGHDLDALGRLNADREFTILRWSAGHSFYLEPLLYRRDWANPDAPYHHTTLAHEISLSFRGQYAFGNTLIPQEEDVIGGFYTVRGYEESLVAGDNTAVFSAEYRFHWPRWRQPGPPGSLAGHTFRYRPEDRYSRPDWDLVLRTFLDVGRVTGEHLPSETLVGTGVGAELSILRNFNLRLDLGVPLKDVEGTDSGETRLHFVGTILY